MKKTLFIAFLTIIILLAATNPVYAALYQDTRYHWAEAEIDRWTGYDVIIEEGNLYYPDQPITRADLALFISRTMNYQEEAENDFHDLDDVDDDQLEAILKLNAAGIMLGDNNYMRPHDSITREEAVVMLGRAMHLLPQQGSTLSYRDSSSISTWAQDMVRSMTNNDYISGRGNGYFHPQDDITRAEAIKVLDNMIAALYNTDGTYSISTLGNVVISADGVTLEQATVTGNLLISEGVEDGTVTLKNLNIAGEVHVYGGGGNGLNIEGYTRVPELFHGKNQGDDFGYNIKIPAMVESFFTLPGAVDFSYTGPVRYMYLQSASQDIDLGGALINNLYVEAIGINLTTNQSTLIDDGYINHRINMLDDGLWLKVFAEEDAEGSSFTLQPYDLTLSRNTTVFAAGQPLANNSSSAQTFSIDREKVEPDTPNDSDLVISNLTDTGFKLDWLASTDNLTASSGLSYGLYYSLYPELNTIEQISKNGILVSDFANNKLTATISGLPRGNTYYFNVVVKDDNENKACYEQVKVAIGADTLAPELDNDKPWITGHMATQLTLNWDPAEDDITRDELLRYAVYRSEDDNIDTLAKCEANGTQVLPYSAATYTYTNTGLKEDTDYYYTVIVQDEAGNKTIYESIEASFTQDTVGPKVNTPQISISNMGENNATLTWQAASDNTSASDKLKYALYSSANNNINNPDDIKTNGKILMPLTLTKFSYDLPIQPDGTTYYNVLVVDESGNESVYQALAISFGSDDTPPHTPQPTLMINNQTLTGVSFSWTAADDQVGGISGTEQGALRYSVYRALERDIPGGASSFASVANIEKYGVLLQGATTNLLSFSSNDLTGGNRYIYNIVVTDNDGYEACYEPLLVSMDTTAPRIVNPALTLAIDTYNAYKLHIIWLPATDDLTASRNLSYAVYMMVGDTYVDGDIANIDTIEKYGQVIMPYTKNVNSATLDYIRYENRYHFYVLVKDEAGNKSMYEVNNDYYLNDTVPPTIPQPPTPPIEVPQPGDPDYDPDAPPVEQPEPLPPVFADPIFSNGLIILSWTEATDNFSPQDRLTYYLYVSDQPDLEIAAIRALTPIAYGRGMSQGSYTVPAGSSGTSFYFYVIVADETGTGLDAGGKIINKPQNQSLYKSRTDRTHFEVIYP